ncbi:MAG: BMP family ABC transporter substrate-binding protein [Actinomycetes bacterium]|jgi:basic membrane protein A
MNQSDLSLKARSVKRLALLTVLALFSLSQVNPAQAAITKKFAIIYDIGGRGDGAINDAAALGVDTAKKSFKFSALDFREMVTDGSESDRETRLRFLAKAGYNLIIAVGSSFSPALQVVGQEYPNTQFAIINDQSVGMVNVTSVVFDHNAGAFLAGILAAITSKTGKVGFIADPQDSNYPILARDFAAGAKYGKASAKAIIRIPKGTPTLDVTALKAAGVDIIFSLWGSSGEVISAITKVNSGKNKIALIGQAPEQYFLASAAAKKILLATVNNRVDLAILTLIRTALDDLTLSDILDEVKGVYGHRFSIADGAIDISNSPATKLARVKITAAKAAIISEKLQILR